MAYIYKITNNINGKMYIGKTILPIEKRFQEHLEESLRERSKNRPLYRAFNKYGYNNFTLSLIEECHPDEASEKEIFWIEYFRTFKVGYNATLGGDGKKYIDYDLVISTYQELKNLSLTAKIHNIHEDSVRNILNNFNIQVLSNLEVAKKYYVKPVNMYDLKNNYICSFSSMNEAMNYLKENNFIDKDKYKERSVGHISEVCNNKRKTFAKHIWKWAE